MWNGRTVSVVLGTYAEKDSIREVIDGYFATGVVDEVVVVNNNAEPGTKEEVDLTAARQVFESKQGYGYSYRRGLAEATGDLIVLSEPDGTFLPRDVVKLLTYSDDCDAVFVSVDIDVCDPGHAPGTGTPEPGGLSARQLLDAVRRLCMRMPVAGVDVVEVSPPYDHADITAALANRVVLEALSGLAWQRAHGREGTFDPSRPLLDGRPPAGP